MPFAVLLLLLMGPLSAISQTKKPVARTYPQARQLSVDDVLGWRTIYGDIVGKAKDVAVERYGPDYATDGSLVKWTASVKTGMRDVWILAPENTIFMVRVFPRLFEYIGVIDVLKKGPLFTYSSDTFSDSTRAFFDARAKNSGSTIRFAIYDFGLSFESALFWKYGE